MTWGQCGGLQDFQEKVHFSQLLFLLASALFPCLLHPLISRVKHPMLVAISGSVFTRTHAHCNHTPPQLHISLSLSKICEQAESQVWGVISTLLSPLLFMIVWLLLCSQHYTFSVLSFWTWQHVRYCCVCTLLCRVERLR